MPGLQFITYIVLNEPSPAPHFKWTNNTFKFFLRLALKTFCLVMKVFLILYPPPPPPFSKQNARTPVNVDTLLLFLWITVLFLKHSTQTQRNYKRISKHTVQDVFRGFFVFFLLFILLTSLSLSAAGEPFSLNLNGKRIGVRIYLQPSAHFLMLLSKKTRRTSVYDIWLFSQCV